MFEWIRIVKKASITEMCIMGTIAGGLLLLQVYLCLTGCVVIKQNALFHIKLMKYLLIELEDWLLQSLIYHISVSFWETHWQQTFTMQKLQLNQLYSSISNPGIMCIYAVTFWTFNERSVVMKGNAGRHSKYI